MNQFVNQLNWSMRSMVLYRWIWCCWINKDPEFENDPENIPHLNLNNLTEWMNERIDQSDWFDRWLCIDQFNIAGFKTILNLKTILAKSLSWICVNQLNEWMNKWTNQWTEPINEIGRLRRPPLLIRPRSRIKKNDPTSALPLCSIVATYQRSQQPTLLHFTVLHRRNNGANLQHFPRTSQ